MSCADCGEVTEDLVALPDGRRVCYPCLFEKGRNVKQTVSCPHCGGVDAHRVDCEGGYGL